jgi:hypothetical protein
MLDAPFTEHRCCHCDELVTPDDDAKMSESTSFGHYHRACVIRLVIGGANHLQGRCTCCGGTEPPDPPHLTKRQAARLALDLWISGVANGSIPNKTVLTPKGCQDSC